MRCHGLAGSLIRATRIMTKRASRLPYLREQHLWWLMDLAKERPHLPLPHGMRAQRLEPAEMQAGGMLTEIGFVERQRRLADGAELWGVTDAGMVVSSCWIFRQRAPALASRGGWFDLPDDAVCMEDPLTLPCYRGRGIASAGWSHFGDALAARGVRAIIGKVKITDTAWRRPSLVRAGFKPIAHMDLTRVWMQPRVTISLLSADWPARWLVEQLST